MTNTDRKTTPKLIIAIALSALMLSGCSMFDWVSGGGSKDQTETERYDDAPITQETGSLPGDRENSRYTNDEPQAE
jgi:hypothetical protein